VLAECLDADNRRFILDLCGVGGGNGEWEPNSLGFDPGIARYANGIIGHAILHDECHEAEKNLERDARHEYERT
jgi:hypothetical protein